jgi:imidazolonepropionase-like amidohydrolase
MAKARQGLSEYECPELVDATRRKMMAMTAKGVAAGLLTSVTGGAGQAADNEPPSLILYNGLIVTLDPANPRATAVAIKDGLFQAVGQDAEILALAGPRTQRIDLLRKGVIPGLSDNHIHIIRGGLNYNMELRWDGVRSLADAMAGQHQRSIPTSKCQQG